MKGFFTAVFAVAVLFLIELAPAQAQDAQTSGQTASSYSNAFSADPIRLLWGEFDASFEHKLSSSNSIVIFGDYWSLGGLWSAYGFGGSYRWYLNVTSVTGADKSALEGFNIGPIASIAFWSWKGASFYDPYGVLSNYSGGTSFQIGASAAYKWVFGGGWFVEPNLSLLVNVGSITGFSGYNAFGFGGNFGYAWK
jgi:hypothetical protein